MQLTYRTQLNYEHRIEDVPVVEDRCKSNHSHDNVEIIVKVETTSEFLDFKTIKDKVEKILEDFRGANITDKFGIGTAEKLASHLGNKISDALNRSVQLQIWETEKYGVEFATNPN
ncbi:MAG: 6-pyruvoyl tetrahydropterin synthase family protein, partial [Nitrosopumilaceae archaeon]